ncbi:hypothetical protein B1199_16025 [Pseudoalteromonas ulvae]|uniref:Uncharacterized protein n=1 Tax=Pseudoalteromonas ulvae TaxID=107327 RepID=A0A244CMN8_PSEDV|nr:hypothetical protein B1199_16025 [Pseudoalteromonas ulvae]
MLPNKITQISVYAGDGELELLTYGSVHHYQPVQNKKHISIMLTNLACTFIGLNECNVLFDKI